MVDMLKLFYQDQDACDVNIKAAEFQKCYTPLHLAAEKGLLECLRLLLQFDEVDVDARDLQGSTTPLLLAIKNKHEKAAVMLIENGANLETKVGRLTLRQFFQENFPETDLSQVKIKKTRPVMTNLKEKLFKLVKETQLSDDDYNAKLSNFKTYLRFVRSLEDQTGLEDVFDVACDKGLHDHVELMLKKGTNPNIASQPLLEAAYYGHHRVVSLMKDYRADFSGRISKKKYLKINKIFH